MLELPGDSGAILLLVNTQHIIIWEYCEAEGNRGGGKRMGREGTDDQRRLKPSQVRVLD